MVGANVKKLIFIVVLTIILSSVSNIFVLKDLYILGIIIVSTILLMLIFDYKKNSFQKNITRFRINIFLVSAFLSLTQIFGTLGGGNGEITLENVVKGFKPMVIGIYVYIVFINLIQGYKREDTIANEVVLRTDEKDNVIIEEVKQEIKQETREEIVKREIRSLNLTRRENEIFNLLIKDLPNKDIADELYIAEATVKKHVQNILKKAECGNRLELIEKYEI